MSNNVTLAEALELLDPAEDSHWTADGLPAIAVLKELTGSHVTREEVTNLRPGFTRAGEPDAVSEAKPPVVVDYDAAVSAAQRAVDEANESLKNAVAARDAAISAEEEDDVPTHVKQQNDIRAYLDSERARREGSDPAVLDQAMGRGVGPRPTAI